MRYIDYQVYILNRRYSEKSLGILGNYSMNLQSTKLLVCCQL